ncbi:UvrB/UvrC motif-containing protein [Candidatus Uhrbacteria bacterium]|nr:UvrB/UvrC motif-containing protein [Candidatus Uhrbacteria bacterium]
MSSLKDQLKALPDSPGVYCFFDASDRRLYIGKATSLKKRVGSYFLKAHDDRIGAMVDQIASIDTQQTASALEALLLEAEMIKKYIPPYNVMEKDDKTFAYIAITKEPIPRVIVVRATHQSSIPIKELYGPYTSAQTARTALKLIRRIFPFHSHNTNTGHPKRPARHTNATNKLCFDATIGLCSGVCGGRQPIAEYRKTLARLRLFLKGKRERTIASLKRTMRQASKAQQYEQAARLRDQLHALEHLRDIAIITRDEFDCLPPKLSSYHIPHRIEAYDISHVFGQEAVGSMVVFTNGKIDSQEYRKFRIRRRPTPDDTRMISEVLHRRLNHPEWRYPDLLLIDGGRPQLHAAQQVVTMRNLVIPVAALAKGPERKNADLYSSDPMAKLVPLPILIRLRDEAHRFAIRYHRQQKRKNLLAPTNTIATPQTAHSQQFMTENPK